MEREALLNFFCPFLIFTGSGSLAAMAVFENGYKPGMEVTLVVLFYPASGQIRSSLSVMQFHKMHLSNVMVSHT